MNIHRFVVIGAMIIVAAAASLVPHPPNFTPLAAIALFAGAHLDRRAAFALAIGSLLVRDMILGVHVLMPVIYACYAFNVFLGSWLNGKHSPARIVRTSLIGSIAFFIVTNFASWIAFDTFSKTADGLLACYLAGIPYFRNTVASDLIYSLAMFGLFALAQSRIPSLRQTTASKMSA
jgi:hypothetical protein